MNPKVKKLMTNWRIILLAIFLVLSLVAIHPAFSEGAAVRSVAVNSSAHLAGIAQPQPNIQPVDREVIISINNRPIKSDEDYYNFISSLGVNRSVQITTDKRTYRFVTRQAYETITLNETEQKTVMELVDRNVTVNGTTETITEEVERTIIVPKVIKVPKGTEDIGLRVYDAPTTNIRKGLDLQGGTRVLLQPQEQQSPEQLSFLIDNMKERLNVYGLSDLVVRDASDLTRNQYIVVEIAGATEDEIKDLLAKQGKFESKIGNRTVFRGGQDIVYVGKSVQDSRIEACDPASANEWVCTFSFAITLSQQAAQRQADITKDLEIIHEQGRNSYLSEKLALYLDDSQVDELNIGADLKGQAVTQIAISGSGVGRNQQEAFNSAAANMKRLQTILVTGSLPVKLNIVKTDSISPTLGEEFVNNAIIMSLAAALAVSVIIGWRYRKMIIAVPILVTMLSEILIMIGIGTFMGWNLDMSAIAGILIAIGTGVNHQIVITDEILKGETDEHAAHNWRERIKRAFMIIMLAYVTVLVAMIPLIFAGAGLLKGFAITTILGASVGVFITRPAYSEFIETVLK
jgi:preprotein translocase subunit SecD